MQLSKCQFLLLILAIFILPFFFYKLFWLSTSEKTNGTMCFMGKSLNGQFTNTYPVIKFSSTGNDTLFFNGNSEKQYQRGDIIPVRYKKNDPTNAKINTFNGMWLDTIIYISVPIVIILIVLFRSDLIKRNAVITIGKKPFIQIN